MAGDLDLGHRFLLMTDKTRYPAGGVSAEAVQEIRRIKARVDAERLPRGADPNTHTKLGRGGLADIEWTVQLLQLRHAHQLPALHNTSTLEALDAIGAAELLAERRRRPAAAGLADRDPGAQRAGAGARQGPPTSCPGRVVSSTPSRSPPAGTTTTAGSSWTTICGVTRRAKAVVLKVFGG